MQDKINKLKELITLFGSNLLQYKSQSYDEANLRVDFADKFFELLDWDVRNTQGFSENYREVVREDKVTIAGKPKAPDYSFRIGGHRKFFVETKRPSVNIKDDSSSAFQIRRYGYTAKLPLCILTDFEEFAVYDTRIKPNHKDSSIVGRVFYCTFKEYEENFDFIFNTFSKNAIMKGSFDKYVSDKKNKKGTSEVDKEFLKLIEDWRNELAKNIAKNNLKLNIDDINFIVQKIINRIIFLRIAEDRHIEDYETLLKLTKRQKVYKHFSELCEKADAKYNSQLFYSEEYLKKIHIDDEILNEIIEGLYYPLSPYEFSVMEVEILGNIYEQFLGKVIRLTAGHHAKVEEKPEVRKAGGVYYTPQYIVDYIVENTLGQKIKDKKPKEIESLSVLDPACGSGSFLLGAYSYLMEYHNKYYTEQENLETALKGNKIYQIGENSYKLTIEEKRKILLNNIYGVDIDSQAVEVTKLSLLLKMMENENQESVGALFKYSDLKVLPNLNNNIKCGNSLIGTDYYTKQDLSLFENNEMKKVNAFDWDKEFPEIFKFGGFDVVIGNPPWGSLFDLPARQYLFSSYINKRGEAESHLFFIEKGTALLKNKGILGFITPYTWLTVLNSFEIRKYMLEKYFIIKILELTKYIFRDAPDIVPILFFVTNTPVSETIIERPLVDKINETNFSESFDKYSVLQSLWLNTEKNVINLHLKKEVVGITSKCNANSIKLSTVCDVLYGIKTGDNNKYLSKNKTDNYKHKALKTAELKRYSINWKGYYIWWNENLAGFRTTPLNIQKIIVQYIRKLSLKRRIIAAMDVDGLYYPLNNYSYIVIKGNGYSLKFILAILNSKLLNYYFSHNYIDYNIKPTYIQNLPIHKINPDNLREKEIINKTIQLVDQVHDAQKKYHSSKNETEKEQLKKKIDIIDSQIDRLVYELYGLKEEEIRIVEKE